MRYNLKRKIDWWAFAWLLVTCAVWGGALWLVWARNRLNTDLIGVSRPGGWTSTLGSEATVVAVVAVPLIIWLGHKAFFSKFGP